MQRLYRSQVNETRVPARLAELLPGSKRFLSAADSQRGRKIIGATHWYGQHRNLLQRKRAQMTVQRAITAKDQCRIRLVSGIELVPGEDIDARQLKRPDVVLLRERSQHGNGAHGERVAYRRRKSK